MKKTNNDPALTTRQFVILAKYCIIYIQKHTDFEEHLFN